MSAGQSSGVERAMELVDEMIVAFRSRKKYHDIAVDFNAARDALRAHLSELAAPQAKVAELEAEVVRLRGLLEMPQNDATHQCKACYLKYTPTTENEDCPNCGFDGASPLPADDTPEKTK